MAKRQAEEVPVQLSQDFDAFYNQPATAHQAGCDEGKRLVITADGKGIVMHPSGLRDATRRAMEQEAHKQQTRLSPGEKKNRLPLATVASVYEVDPYPRTPSKSSTPNNSPRVNDRDHRTNGLGRGSSPRRGRSSRRLLRKRYAVIRISGCAGSC